MSVPSVSIVIPAFNSVETLPRALDSVFAQSFRDYEVIVVDDGSTDDLAAALQPFRERVKLIRQSNQGPAVARNRAVREAQGEYLAFLDADDFWHPNKLELQLGAFRQRPDIVLCWTGHGNWQPGDARPSTVIAVPADALPVFSRDFKAIFLAPYLGTPGVMLPKAVFVELGGFREDLRSAEDIDLWLRVAYRGETALIPQALFYVVSTPNSVTARLHDTTFKDNLKVIDDFCAAHPPFAAAEARAVRGAKAQVYEDWGSGALVAGDLKRASDLLIRSMRLRVGNRAAYLWVKALARRALRPLIASAVKRRQ